MPDTQPNRLGKYEILAEIGKGGFATAYRARDPDLGREVALKVLDPLLMRDPAWVARFRQEARVIAALDHPRIVPIYEIGQAEGILFIAMKLLDSGSLAGRIARGPLPWADVVRLTGEIAEGLDCAHARGVLHRDLKPANVLLDADGHAVLTDFGFARLVADHSLSVSVSGGIVGTPAYIAPEVWDGEAPGKPADLYALGCIVYEMAAGVQPFTGATTPAVMRAHFRPLVLPAAWPEGTPPGLGDVLRTALAQAPADRYASAGELAEALAGLSVDRLAKPYATLQAAVAAHDWSQALTLAGQIRTQKPDYRDVVALEAEALAGQEHAARAEQAATWRAETEAALARGDHDAAALAARQWAKLTPDDPALAALRAKLEARQAPPAKSPEADTGEVEQPRATAPAGMATRSRRLPLAAGGIALLALVLALWHPWTGGGGGEIKVAILAPLTGVVPTFGASTRDGALLAIEQWNARGGPLGKPIIPIVEDSRCEPDPAADAANKVIHQDKAGFIIGEICSAASIPVSEIANANKVLQISPTSSNPLVTVGGDGKTKDYVFRACFLDPFQGEAGARFAAGNLKARTAFIMFDQANVYSSGLAESFEMSFARAGGTIVGKDSYASQDSDFTAILARVAETKPDLVYLPDYYDVANLVIRQAKALGIPTTFLGGDGWESSELDLKAAAGSYFTNHYSPDSTTPTAAEFRQAFAARYQTDPDALAALAYDAANLLLQSIENAGSDDPTRVKDAVAGIRFQGVTGWITFDAQHNPVKSVTILKVTENGMVFDSVVNP